MSDHEDEDTSQSSSDESEDINVTGLVATRAKRGNAGNLYETLRAHLDDEDIQVDLLEEDELDDAEDYNESDASDDNDVLDSSSDEDDAGPAQAGDVEDLSGEKELKQAERQEKSKKRKAQTAKLVIPAFKKVKLADHVTADDGSVSPIEPPKKKIRQERRSDAVQPMRKSVRSSAVANREVTQANLQESEARARKQKATLQETVKRAKDREVELTLEQRLEKCKRIEKETAKELGRFEREEAERVRLREEALLAKRRKAIDGPLLRTLTTSGCYENGKLKIKRMQHGSQQLDDLKTVEGSDATQDAVEDTVKLKQTAPEAGVLLAGDQSMVDDDISMADVKMEDVQHSMPSSQTQEARHFYYPSAPIVTGLLVSFSSSSTQINAATLAVPVVREQAQRSLLTLESFDALDSLSTSRRSKTVSAFEPTPIAQILLPDSYPSFTDEQQLYLKKPKKYKTDVVTKARCALTTWAGKYRDPKTGVVFADVAAYKMLQRMIAGGFTWNAMLQCWTGPAYGQMGRPARGVPAGFDKPVESVETR